MIYVLIILLIVAQIFVVFITVKKTIQQKNIFDIDSSRYSVEKFYIPKNELAKISYRTIDISRQTYKNAGDTIGYRIRKYYDEVSGQEKEMKIKEVTCKACNKIPVSLIQIKPGNYVAKEIQNVINNYLIRNKGAASDYSLIKDIVERNCTNLEEEIETQTPWPLYLGLMGTMAGIIIGIGSISLTVGFETFVQQPEEYIGNLMGDVAVAMIVSLFGIAFTTFLSHMAKEAKKVIETKKNAFYSWFQAELMPIITRENATSEFNRLEENLARFNNSFARNVNELNNTFSVVRATSHDQASLLNTLQKMNLKQLATSNIEILSKFNDTIGRLEDFNEYIEYAKHVMADIQLRNSAITEATISVDQALDKSFTALKENVDKQIAELSQSLAMSGNAMDKLIENENKLLTQQGTKIESFYQTIQDLKPIITGLSEWKKTLSYQTQELNKLSLAIGKFRDRPMDGHVTVKSSPLNMIIGGVIGFIVIILMAFNMYFIIQLNSNIEDIRENVKVDNTQMQNSYANSIDSVAVNR